MAIALCSLVMMAFIGVLTLPLVAQSRIKSPTSPVTSTLVTGQDAGAGPQVRGLDGSSLTPIHDFVAYAPSFGGGVRVAVGDVNGDGVADIITGPGAGGGPNVKVFDGKTEAPLHSFFAFT